MKTAEYCASQGLKTIIAHHKHVESNIQAWKRQVITDVKAKRKIARSRWPIIAHSYYSTKRKTTTLQKQYWQIDNYNKPDLNFGTNISKSWLKKDFHNSWHSPERPSKQCHILFPEYFHPLPEQLNLMSSSFSNAETNRKVIKLAIIKVWLINISHVQWNCFEHCKYTRYRPKSKDLVKTTKLHFSIIYHYRLAHTTADKTMVNRLWLLTKANWLDDTRRNSSEILGNCQS